MRHLFLILIFASIPFLCLSQNDGDFKINSGYGLWEGIHLGISYNISNYLLGIDYGKINNFPPYDAGKSYSIVLNNSYFFGKNNKFDFKTNYFYVNVLYNNCEEFISIYDIVQINPGIGKEFYIYKNIGFNIQGGLTFPIYVNKKYKYDIEEKVFWLFPIMPELILEFVFRFKTNKNKTIATNANTV